LSFFFGENVGNELKTIKEDLEERHKNLFPKKAMERILMSGTGDIYMKNKEEFIKLLRDTATPEQIEKLVKFKEDFLSNLFHSQRYTIEFADFQKEFSQKVNYRDILEIYVFLNGNPDISNLSQLNSSALYLWIS